MNETEKVGVKPSHLVNLVVDHDIANLRVMIEAMVVALNDGPKSRQRSLATTKLEEAAFWLEEAAKRE